MGIHLKRTVTEAGEPARFAQLLAEQLEQLETTLAQPGFGVGEASVGAELELNLVDANMRPSGCNMEVRAATADPRVTLELNRFNLELNARHTLFKGQPFAALKREITDGLDIIRAAAHQHGARLALMGILPTLRKDDLGPHFRTPAPRYDLLAHTLREQRGRPFDIRVNGEDPLEWVCDDVALEGANTSWQLHLRVDPERFADTYNAMQLATPVVLAVSGNSPLFVGHRLWEETRIALFKQAVDARLVEMDHWRRPPRVCVGHGWVQKDALELFRQSVLLYEPLLPICSTDTQADSHHTGAPALRELRLHHGTVWSWNRAVYDCSGGGHLRIEFRALAAGPTLTDMLANSAFALGLALALAPSAPRWTSGLPFELLRHNLYRSAEKGLAAELLWPTDRAPSPRALSARELALELLPRAAEGLREAGVEESDFGPLLELLRERISTGRTGAAWQRAQYTRCLEKAPQDQALAAMLSRYVELSETEAPVHTWPGHSA